MTNEACNDMAKIWKNQPTARVNISLEQLRRKAGKLQSRVLWRNLREYAAGALVIGTFGYMAWTIPPLLPRLGCALLIAGTFYILATLHKRGASAVVPAEMAFQTCIDFHRSELERQRDLLHSAWSWYLLPLVPGMTVFLVGLLVFTLQQPNAKAHASVIIAAFAFIAIFCAMVFLGIDRLNRWAARKLQDEIERLDVLTKES